MRYSNPIAAAFACTIISASVLADGPPKGEVVLTATNAAGTAASVPASEYRIQVTPRGAVLVRDGKAAALQKQVTLTDGTTIQPDGAISRADGTTLKLAEGEWLDVNGAVGHGASPKSPAPVTGAAGVMSSKGTDSVSQAGLDQGTAEAERRTKQAIDEAVTAAPNNSAK